MSKGEHYYYGTAKTGAPIVGEVETQLDSKPSIDWSAWGLVVLALFAVFMAFDLIWSWLP